MTLSQQELERLRKLGKMPATGVKADAGKAPLAQLSSVQSALGEIARVLEHGAKKYGRDNWRKGMPWTQPASAALRHLFAYLRGEDKDPDTGLHCLAHAGCEVLFLLTYALEGLGTDDRKESK